MFVIGAFWKAEQPHAAGGFSTEDRIKDIPKLPPAEAIAQDGDSRSGERRRNQAMPMPSIRLVDYSMLRYSFFTGPPSQLRDLRNSAASAFR